MSTLHTGREFKRHKFDRKKEEGKEREKAEREGVGEVEKENKKEGKKKLHMFKFIFIRQHNISDNSQKNNVCCFVSNHCSEMFQKIISSTVRSRRTFGFGQTDRLHRVIQCNRHTLREGIASKSFIIHTCI